MYIKVDSDTFIKFNEEDKSTVVYSKKSLEDTILMEQETLLGLVSPSDEELLSWARNNHPSKDIVSERESLQNDIAEKQAILTEVYG